jgi:hypothetical protein
MTDAYMRWGAAQGDGMEAGPAAPPAEMVVEKEFKVKVIDVSVRTFSEMTLLTEDLGKLDVFPGPKKYLSKYEHLEVVLRCIEYLR